MRRALSILLTLLLLLPAGGLAGEGYVFDLADRESTRQSCGTGGTVSRYVQATPEEMGYMAYNSQTLNRNWWGVTGPKVVKKVHLQDPILKQMVIDWFAQAQAQLQADGHSGEYVQTLERYGPLINLVAENGTSLRSAVLDAETYQWLSLSDIFYDGFNYIEFINNTLAAGLIQQDRTLFDLEDVDMWSAVEDYLKRPFTGFAADYPYFRIALDGLTLRIDGGNPFFTVDKPRTSWGFSLWIPLSHEISPFAGCEVQYIIENAFFGDEQTGFPVLAIDNDTRPQEARAIQDDLRIRLTAALQQDRAWMDRIREVWYVRLQPKVRQRGRFLSITYELSDEEERYGILFSQVYDLHTGACIDTRALLEAWCDHPDTRYYRQDDAHSQSQDQREMERPPDLDQATIYSVAFYYEGPYLSLRLPGDQYVLACLPPQAMMGD